jgi:hypothetical protein
MKVTLKHQYNISEALRMSAQDKALSSYNTGLMLLHIGPVNMKERKLLLDAYCLAQKNNYYVAAWRNGENLLKVAVDMGDVEPVDWAFFYYEGRYYVDSL